MAKKRTHDADFAENYNQHVSLGENPNAFFGKVYADLMRQQQLNQMKSGGLHADESPPGSGHEPPNST